MCKEYFYMRISTQSREDEEKQKEQSFDRQKGIFERNCAPNSAQAKKTLRT